MTMQGSSTNVPTFTQSLIAGGIAGTTVDLSLYPIDTLKTRLQSSAGFSGSGGFGGIYKGVGSAVVGSAPGAALFFVTYERCKTILRERRRSVAGHFGADDGVRIPWGEPIEHMVAASLGEIAACAVRVPTEVIKQRAQASQYASSMAALRDILGQRRRKGWGYVGGQLYRGWSVTILREVPFTMIQFPLWEGMKQWRRRQTGRDAVSAIESAVFGSIAGAAAAGFTTPLDVLKTRIMLSKQKERTGALVAQILRDSGPRAFFAGLGPRIVWISAGGAIFLGSYEWAYNALRAIG